MSIKPRWTAHLGKSQDHVQLPASLDLRKYAVTPGDKSKQYRLRAVIVHVGRRISSGHFYAYVQVKQRGVWIKCDDERRSLVEKEEVYSAPAYAALYVVEGV